MFDKVFCLNLDKRPDRWEECQEEFKKIKWPVERFPGIDGDANGSYINCLKEASKYNSSLILEDDIQFLDIDKMYQSLADLPKGWDLVSLGANLPIHHHQKVTDRLYRYECGWATQAVGYSKRLATWIAEKFDFNSGKIYDDWFKHNVLSKFNCYIVKPMAAYQRPSFSDLLGRYVDYTEVFENSQRMLA